MTFSVADIPDLTGKVVIVTGANTGIGRVSAVEMAKKGAHVILACRSKERTQAALDEIAAANPNAKAEFMELDLMSLKSVDRFADAFRERNLPLHVLLNNAGIMANPYTLTKDGVESQFGTNHLGHFHLTNKLLDILEKNAPSRIVNVSSAAHKFTRNGMPFTSLEQLNNEKEYSSWAWYGNSKVSNILFTLELNKRLAGKNVYANSLHPGMIKTELSRNLSAWIRVLFTPISFFSLTPLQGALTQLYVATHPDIESKNIRGQYFVPTATLAQPNDLAKDEKAAHSLWEFSEKLVKEKLSQPVESSESKETNTNA